jgi:hypothetical protein
MNNNNDIDWTGCRLIFDKKKELWAMQKKEYGEEYGYSLAEPLAIEELEPCREGLPKAFYEYLIYVSREIFCYVYPVKLELFQIEAACNSYCKYCKGYESSDTDTDTDDEDEFPYFLYIGDGGSPNKVGHESPNKVGHESPNKVGHESPNKVGHESPNKVGHESPNKVGHYISLCKGREDCNRHKYSFGKIAEMADENNHLEQDDFISYLCSIPINQALLQQIIKYDVYVMKQQKERMKLVLKYIFKRGLNQIKY